MLALVLGGALALRVGLANHPLDEIDALFGACFASLGMALCGRERRLPRSWLGLGVVFSSLIWMSAWSSPHRIVAAFAIPSWWAPGFVFCACALLPRCAVPRLVAFLALPCILSAGTALYQRWVLWPETLQNVVTSPEITARLQSGRPLGLSLSPDLGGALALLGFVCALFLLRDAPPRHKLLWTAAAGLCLAGVAASASAGVALALGAFGGLWGILWLWRTRHLPWRKAGLLVLPLLPVAAIALLARGPDALARSMDERLWNWKIAWLAFVDSPLLGFGPGRFAAAYAQHRLHEANVTRYAHSAFFHGLVEIGALGTLCLAALCVVVVGGLFSRGIRDRNNHGGVNDFMWAAGLALGLRCAFDYDAQIAQTACGLAAWWGLMWARLAPISAEPPVTTHRPLQAFLGTSALTFLFLLGLLQPRNALLAATEGDSPIEKITMEQLQTHAERFPMDVHVAARFLHLRLEALRHCDVDCDERREVVERWVSEQLQMPMAPPPFYVASARLARMRDDMPMAHAQLAAGLKQTPGDLGLRALSVLLAETQDARSAAYAESLLWQSRQRLENTLRYFHSIEMDAASAAPRSVQ